MRRSRGVPAVAVLMLMAVAQPTWAQSASTPADGETPKSGGDLVVAISGDINTTDSAFSQSIDTMYVQAQALESLVEFAPGSSDPAPALAKSWTVSDDGLTYTFELQPDVTFHDGTPFDAAAVCYNFDRWNGFTGTLASADYSYYAQAIFGGYGADANYVSCEASSPSQAVITLKTPIASFLRALTLPEFAPNSPTALQALDADNPDPTKSPYGTGAPGAMNGTGPFIFKEWVPSDHITFVRNPNYWDKSKTIYLDSITFKPTPNTASIANAVQSGDVDMATAINPSDIPTFDDSVVTVPRGESCNTFFIALNQAKQPLDSLQVRQAISYAINKEALIDTFYGGVDYAEVANTWIPPVVPGHKDVLPAYDPEKARQILGESGLTPEDLTIDFYYPSDVFRAYMPDPSGLFQVLKSDLEAVGFTINPQTKPWRDGYISGIYGGEFPMGIIGWPCDYPTPDNFLDTGMFYYSGGEPNTMFAYDNDDLNAMMKEAQQMPSIEAAVPTWEQVQDQLALDLPSIPLIHSVAVAALGSDVKGYEPSVGVVEHLDSIWLDN